MKDFKREIGKNNASKKGNNKLVQISFNILSYGAFLSSNFNKNSLDCFVRKPDLSHISPMQRRRLSKNTKACFSLANELKFSKMPIVFSSNLGEINRCFQLHLDLARKEPISPTSFSLSVHNASAAVFNIFCKNNCEISAISSTSSLEYGILESYLKLDEENKKVFLIVHFEDINQDYYFCSENAYILALIIEKGNDFKLSFDSSSNKNANLHSSIDFLQAMQENKKLWEIYDNNLIWQWINDKN